MGRLKILLGGRDRLLKIPVGHLKGKKKRGIWGGSLTIGQGKGKQE